MTDKQRSFQIIPCPIDIRSSPTHLVVSGRGAPHEPLTLFYEELQKSCTPGKLYAIMDVLLPFFSFLEEPQSLREVALPRMHGEWSSCMAAMQGWSFPASMAWAAPPSALQGAIRFYLADRWGCLTRQRGEYEEIRLSPRMEGGQELHLFLTALQRFYQFVIERQDYWYERNPAEAFRLPLRSRLLQAIAPRRFSARSRATRDQRNVGEVIKERPTQTVGETQDKALVLSR